MKRFARALVVTLGIAVIGAVVSLVPQKKAAAQDGGPTVTIGGPIPLPVKGNVNATVTFNGIAQPVSLSSQPTAPLFARDADNAARHPFTTACTLAVNTGFSGFAGCEAPAVPAGQEVVIETVSLGATADPANVVLAADLLLTASGVRRTFNLNPSLDTGIQQPSNSSFQSAQSHRFYADPGTTIGCAVTTKGPNPNVGLTGQCAFLGYFVSLP